MAGNLTCTADALGDSVQSNFGANGQSLPVETYAANDIPGNGGCKKMIQEEATQLIGLRGSRRAPRTEWGNLRGDS